MDRAVSLLAAYRPGDKALSVTELAERTRLYKSTVLRLLASLAHGRLVQKTPDGLWALGAEVARLAGIYSASFALEDVLLPEMRALVERTQESVAFHVRQGDQRLVLLRVDSPHLLRDHVRAGDVLPLDRNVRALSAEQMTQLTSDLVWLVEPTVTLQTARRSARNWEAKCLLKPHTFF